MSKIEKFPLNSLESICNILAATSSRLTGTGIGKYLARSGIPDTIANVNKRTRLYEALSAKQSQDDCANSVILFIQTVMDPVNHTVIPAWFNEMRADLNKVLAFSGLELGEDGKCHASRKANTLTDAEQKAEKLKRILRERGVHPDVLKYCQARLLEDNYFHAILEASKSVSEKIRQQTGLVEDGAALVDKAFGFRSVTPFLAFSMLTTETQQSEQTGLMNLMKGIISAFRNPTAHEAEIKWSVSEQDAMDLLVMVSFLHRRIDAAQRTHRTE